MKLWSAALGLDGGLRSMAVRAHELNVFASIDSAGDPSPQQTPQ